MRARTIAAGGALAALLAQAPGRASPGLVLPEDVRQAAMGCVGEAAQICPDVWTAQDHGLACMAGKRERFSPRCRAVYDEVARALGRAVTGRPPGRQPRLGPSGSPAEAAPPGSSAAAKAR